MTGLWGPPRRGPGRLIAFEGSDGSGKSTQAQLLHRWLLANGIESVLTAWNSSPLVSPATGRAKRRRALTPLTYALVHACDLADRWEQSMAVHLEAGHVVIADRYVFTGLARDAARGCDPQWVRALYGFAPLPHLTVYCALAPAEAAERILATRGRLKFYESGLDVAPAEQGRHPAFLRYQASVDRHYDALAAEFGFLRLDGAVPVPDQHAEVCAAVAELLGGRITGPVPSESEAAVSREGDGP
jgi:dTMP kinase